MNEDKIKTWEIHVGRFMLASGRIELCLLQLYWNISIGGHYDENVKTDSFSKKIKRIRKDIRQSGIGIEIKEEILKTLNRCSGLIKTRNLVAHNPLNLDILLDEEGLPEYEPLIRSLRDHQEHLSERELIESIEEMRMIDEEFYNILPDDRLWNWREA